jgi:hypothetical protein
MSSGRVALVTGGENGIGAASAVALGAPPGGAGEFWLHYSIEDCRLERAVCRRQPG